MNTGGRNADGCAMEDAGLRAARERHAVSLLAKSLTAGLGVPGAGEYAGGFQTRPYG
jgi:hypothetical protein